MTDADKLISSLAENLAVSRENVEKYFLESITAPYYESLPYSWHIGSTIEVARFEYRGRFIVMQRKQWVAPEKTRPRVDFPFMQSDRTERPEELDENNTAIVYRTLSFEYEDSHRTFDSVIEAQDYIDDELALDAQTESLAPIIAFLKDLPCNCGEYGSIEYREYIRYAAQLAEIVKP